MRASRGQIADVERDVAALLILERVFLAEGHVAADEAGQDRRDVIEIVARLLVPRIGAGEGGVDRAAIDLDRTENTLTLTADEE